MNTDGRSKKNGYEYQQPISGGNDIPDAWSAVCVLRHEPALHREPERVSARAQHSTSPIEGDVAGQEEPDQLSGG